MKVTATYGVKIKHYSQIFKQTIDIYRSAVDFIIEVCLNEWEGISAISGSKQRQSYVEKLIHSTAGRPEVPYSFDRKFYKFPGYLRRSAINEAIGKAASYKSNLASWDKNPTGRKPSPPRAGYVYPCLYRGDMYEQDGDYTARIKVFVRNTWDWIEVSLKKSDCDYITRHLYDRKKCAPTLQKRGKEWYLDFPLQKNVELNSTPVMEQTIIAVDLGLNNACVCTAMTSDGTVAGRHFLKLPAEKDCLDHSINRIKKAQQHGAKRIPRLWARAKGINADIASKTAGFIMDVALLYSADVIVFEHLELRGRKKGSKKQKLHMWKCRDVQKMVYGKAHLIGMRVSHICAWGTSRLAYDGSGRVSRGIDGNYSICQFANGRIYNCDLSASYNIGARYFIREILKSMPETAGLALVAKVPQAARRSTCTLSTLISLNAAMCA